MSEVDNLLSQINSGKGAAVSNRYRVIFGGNNDSEKISFLCDSVTLPGRQILTTDYMTTMKSYKKPYAFANDDVTISFILTNDWFTWNFLKEWQSSTISNIDVDNGAYSVKLKSEYVKRVTIQHLTKANEVTKTYILYNAFPTTLNSIELSNSSENQIIRCTAVLAYDNWQAIDVGFGGGDNVKTNLPRKDQPVDTSPDFEKLPEKDNFGRINPNFGSLPRKDQSVKINQDFGPLPRKEQPIRINQDFGPLPRKEQPIRINPDFGPLPSRGQPVKINPDFGPLPSRGQPVKINPDFGPLPRKDQPINSNIDLQNLPRIT